MPLPGGSTGGRQKQKTLRLQNSWISAPHCVRGPTFRIACAVSETNRAIGAALDPFANCGEAKAHKTERKDGTPPLR